jgi:hypothetical protein
MIRLTVLLLTLLASLPGKGLAESASTNSAAKHPVLIIDQSVTAVSGAKATLSIGPLQRTGNIYAGDYHMKVSPYFFKGEKGRLAIVVSDKSMARVTNGLGAEIIGTATSNGDGETRRIDAQASPADRARGTLKLWFLSGDHKLVFNTSYRFIER